ncbi:hypothetical protein JTE90_005739 [Oedothorax gibbosus]|uniref:Gamma-tubulin complex component 6 n=1 Tax=Oedothorax gibbosus TaxID=931172 RepID=A0AAV6US93_9ARAC|nr:hypothetical protein JTE90_005739 [Oedothorax gibbosus]
MEKQVHYHKLLHLLIEQFLAEFERNVELRVENKSCVYFELLKRSSIISQDIVTLASSFLTSVETAAVPITEEAISKRIKCLVESSLQQDLIECALISKDVSSYPHLSKDNLHDILYICSANGKSAAVPFSMFQYHQCSSETEGMSSGHIQSYLAASNKNNLICPLSNQFGTTFTAFETELVQLRHSVGMGASNVELMLNDVSPATEASPVNHLQSSKSPEENFTSSDIEHWLHSVLQSQEDGQSHQPVKDSFLGWESGVRQSVPCHLYTSELTGREVSLNVIDEDPHVFRSLHDPSGVVSEYDYIHDVLDLLVGIPSETFIYNKIQKKFHIKSQSCLYNLSHESTLKFSETFIESGTTFHRLKLFYTECIPSVEGLVLKGLKTGIKEILSSYMEYIASVRLNDPTMLMLRKDVAQNAELISSLGVFCGLSVYENNVNTLPKGLGLLSFLSKLSCSNKSKENAIMVAVLLKFTYSPYFQFLNKWLTTGICCDPYSEFQILEDVRYLDRTDEFFWKLAYTNIEGDSFRIIPPELEKYAHDILQCGKSMRLLQNCCPQLCSLEYMCSHPPPCFSMVFSYHAVNAKRDECTTYILQKENSESERKSSKMELSENEFLLKKQLAVERKVILSQIQRRWNQHKKAPNLFLKSSSDILGWSKEEIPKRCKSFPCLPTLSDETSFSGIILEKTGILFGSCFGAPLLSEKKFSLVSCSSENNQSNKLRENCPTMMNASEIGDRELKEPSSGNHIGLDSFVNSLASLLLSDYGDSLEDICSFLQLTSLQNLMQYNFSAVMSMRMHLVQKTVVDYVINELKLKDLLLCLKNTYFLQDECFSQSLGKRLFNWAMKCESLDEFAGWSVLNQMLAKSVAVPSLVNVPFLETASVNFVMMPEEYVSKRNKFMQYFNFEFKIDWPLNIIIHKDSINHYSKIFSFIMEMEFLCWLLAKVWRLLLISAKENNLENSPQFRKLMLDRFDMHQFIRVLRNCVHQDLGGPLWECLEKSLRADEIGIDALENIHKQYLERAMARCFLTTETAHLHDVLEFLFDQVERFCRAALDCTWKLRLETNHFESSEFENLYDSYSKYQKLKETFYERVMKMVRRKTFQRLYDEHYQLYLETILETSRNM